jgi:hypothetical protein
MCRSRAADCAAVVPQSLGENFPYVFKGAPRRVGLGRARPRAGRGRAEVIEGTRELAWGSWREPAGGWQGGAPTPRRQPAAPHGRKPTGRGAAAGWLPPRPTGGQSRTQRAYDDRADWPGRNARAECADRRGSDHSEGRGAAHCPGRPLQRQGHRRSFLRPRHGRSRARHRAGRHRQRLPGRQDHQSRQRRPVPDHRPRRRPGPHHRAPRRGSRRNTARSPRSPR